MLPQKIEIQKVTMTDALALQEISRKTFFDSYAAFNTEENVRIYLDVNFGLEQLKKELADINSEFYFAMSASKPVGYFKVNFEKAQTVSGYPNTTEIERIYVLKELQGKKIGSILIEKCKEIAKQNKHNYVWLGVWENNNSAIDFYKAQNFEIFGSHPFLFGEDLQTDHLMKIKI